MWHYVALWELLEPVFWEGKKFRISWSLMIWFLTLFFTPMSFIPNVFANSSKVMFLFTHHSHMFNIRQTSKWCFQTLSKSARRCVKKQVSICVCMHSPASSEVKIHQPGKIPSRLWTCRSGITHRPRPLLKCWSSETQSEQTVQRWWSLPLRQH